MKPRYFAILFSLVLLLMTFSAAAADHLAEQGDAETTLEYWDTYGDERFAHLGPSLPSQSSISCGDYWRVHSENHLASQEGASLVSRISIAGADYWSFFKDQLDSQEGASLNSQLTISGDEDWAYQQ